MPHFPGQMGQMLLMDQMSSTKETASKKKFWVLIPPDNYILCMVPDKAQTQDRYFYQYVLTCFYDF